MRPAAKKSIFLTEPEFPNELPEHKDGMVDFKFGNEYGSVMVAVKPMSMTPFETDQWGKVKSGVQLSPEQTDQLDSLSDKLSKHLNKFGRCEVRKTNGYPLKVGLSQNQKSKVAVMNKSLENDLTPDKLELYLRLWARYEEDKLVVGFYYTLNKFE